MGGDDDRKGKRKNDGNGQQNSDDDESSSSKTSLLIHRKPSDAATSQSDRDKDKRKENKESACGSSSTSSSSGSSQGESGDRVVPSNLSGADTVGGGYRQENVVKAPSNQTIQPDQSHQQSSLTSSSSSPQPKIPFEPATNISGGGAKVTFSKSNSSKFQTTREDPNAIEVLSSSSPNASCSSSIINQSVPVVQRRHVEFADDDENSAAEDDVPADVQELLYPPPKRYRTNTSGDDRFDGCRCFCCTVSIYCIAVCCIVSFFFIFGLGVFFVVFDFIGRRKRN